MKRLAALSVAALGAVIAEAACAGPENPAPPPRAPVHVEAPPEAPPSPPPSYVLIDPDALPSGRTVVLDGAAMGVVLDGVRVVVSPSGAMVARELTIPSLSSVSPIPPWLGGGFLFQTATSIYKSAAFDGPLEPLVAFASAIQPAVFGPTGLLIRSASGERWSIDLPSGARASPSPLGLLDIVATADGRAAAITEAGGALVSIDRGAHFTDVAGALRSTAVGVVLHGDAPEFQLANRGVMRLDASGKLTEFPASPPAPKRRFRDKDPRWHAADPPLRAVLEHGAALEDHTALVAAAGDVVRVDLRSGAIVGVSAGRLPPDLPCDAERAGDTTLFVCAAGGRPAIVASMQGATGPLKIEMTFAEKALFYASDDGSLAYAGTCAGEPKDSAVCVRDDRGAWSELAIAGEEDVLDSGVASANTIVRWVPSSDGRAVGLAVTSALETVNPATGKRRPIRTDGEPKSVLEPLTRAIGRGAFAASEIIDRTWSTTSRGTLRGWLENGQTVEIESDGDVKVSAYSFPRVVVSGPFALARSSDGRAFQTTDAGVSWLEVSPPPTSTAAVPFDPHACSSVGCDLGVWGRIGWDASTPETLAVPFDAADPPLLQGAPPVDVTCVTAGDVKSAELAPTPESPEDFGFGASRIPLSKDFDNGRTFLYEHRAFSRTPANPAHAVSDEGAPRAMIHGYGVQLTTVPNDKGTGTSRIEVLGPRRDASAFERRVSFIAPFDPSAAIHTAKFGASALGSVAKSLSFEALLFSSGTFETSGMIPITPLDPAAPSGYLFEILGDTTDLLGVVSPAASSDVKIGWPHPRRRSVVSAIEIDKDAIVVLAESDSGVDSVYKMGKAGVADLGDLPTPPSSDAYPANPDAIAVGPQNALAILRMPSGAEPPSALSPALLIPLGGRPIALAPWSTLTSAEDAACRADTNAYRATIQVIAPWVRLRGAGMGDSDSSAPMVARVRWSETRVCLEGLETRESVLEHLNGDAVETWVVARFVAPIAAGRVSMALGSESRQPLTCSLGGAKSARP